MSSNPKKKVVVCGGGVIGVCTAYFLAKGGADVTVVEQSGIACAASGKAGGFLALDWCRGPVDSLSRLSFKLHRELAEQLGDKYEYRQLSTLSLQVDQPKDTSKHKRAAPRGLPAWIDGPVKGFSEIGSPSTTAQVNPRLFTETLLEEAQARHGVRVRIGRVEGVTTARLANGAACVSEVLVQGEALPADAVVFAMGPWTSQLQLLSPLVRISGLKANSILLRPKREEAISAHALFLTFRAASGKLSEPEIYPRASGLVYVCGMSSDGNPPRDPATIGSDPGAPQYLHDVAATVSSQLADAEVVEAQACYLPCSEDGFPVIGRVPGLEGAFVGTGHSCWGILNAPATGLVLSELVLEGRATSVDVSAFDPQRFGKVFAQ